MKDALTKAEEAADKLDDAMREAHDWATLQRSEKGEMYALALADMFADVSKVRQRLGLLLSIAEGKR